MPRTAYLYQLKITHVRTKLELQRETDTERARRPLSSAKDTIPLAQAILRHAGNAHVENLLTLHLDGRNRLAAYHIVSIGTVSSSLAHPREIFSVALEAHASALVLLHNHPSGDPTPSNEDDAITKRIHSVGETIGIPLLDHLVINMDDERYYSYLEHGTLPSSRPAAAAVTNRRA